MAVGDTLKTLAADAERLRNDHDDGLEQLLKRLEELDSELATRVIEVFGNRSVAARWLARRRPCFRDQNPYPVIARGERQDVLDALGRIDHGTFG